MGAKFIRFGAFSGYAIVAVAPAGSELLAAAVFTRSCNVFAVQAAKSVTDSIHRKRPSSCPGFSRILRSTRSRYSGESFSATCSCNTVLPRRWSIGQTRAGHLVNQRVVGEVAFFKRSIFWTEARHGIYSGSGTDILLHRCSIRQLTAVNTSV